MNFSKARANYEEIFRIQLRDLDNALANGAVPIRAHIDESREVHAREYIVNALLAALNWRMSLTPTDGLPNLIPESAIASNTRGTKRFLDYLGIEAGTTNPLLLVETKRPRTELPTLAARLSPALSYEEIVVRGLRGERLTGDWNKWLSTDLTDYVRSLHAKAGVAPKRLLMTNGDWLILFIDPEQTFLGHDRGSVGTILVCQGRTEILDRAHDLFEHLEHSRVLGGVKPLRVAELPFYVEPQLVDTAMHGLHLLYDEEPGIHAPSAPRIKVAPVVFLGSRFGAWIIVEGTIDYDIPRDQKFLRKHLDDVRIASEELLASINQILRRQLIPRSIEDHYSDDVAFSIIPGVKQMPGSDRTFRLVTGSTTHYLKPTSSVANCPFHDHAIAANHGHSAGALVVLRRSTVPRAFFYSKEENHCAHGDVRLAKRSPISALNEARCGSRSRGRGAAFCEIWPFETHLCCRTCTYEPVCTAAEVFFLPCSLG